MEPLSSEICEAAEILRAARYQKPTSSDHAEWVDAWCAIANELAYQLHSRGWRNVADVDAAYDGSNETLNRMLATAGDLELKLNYALRGAFTGQPAPSHPVAE